MDERELAIKNEDKSDLVGKTKTIYDAGPGEIFWKNFLAGLGRSLGGIFIYLIFLVIFCWLFYSLVLPKIMPSINSYLNIFNTLGSISNSKPESGSTLLQNADLLKLFGR